MPWEGGRLWRAGVCEFGGGGVTLGGVGGGKAAREWLGVGALAESWPVGGEGGRVRGVGGVKGLASAMCGSCAGKERQ